MTSPSSTHPTTLNSIGQKLNALPEKIIFVIDLDPVMGHSFTKQSMFSSNKSTSRFEATISSILSFILCKRRIAPDTLFAIASLTDSLTLLCEFTADYKQLIGILNSLQPLPQPILSCNMSNLIRLFGSWGCFPSDKNKPATSLTRLILFYSRPSVLPVFPGSNPLAEIPETGLEQLFVRNHFFFDWIFMPPKASKSSQAKSGDITPAMVATNMLSIDPTRAQVFPAMFSDNVTSFRKQICRLLGHPYLRPPLQKLSSLEGNALELKS